MEPVLGRGALPSESERFSRVDRDFRKFVNSTYGGGKSARPVNSLVVEYREKTKLSELTAMMEQLGRCQKNLIEYLEQKRVACPRLYFIGDEDLLEILGRSEEVEVVQTHLRNLFGGVHRVEIGEEKRITAMVSVMGEVVNLEESISITRSIEDWLKELDRGMVETLKKLVMRCGKNGKFSDFPGQILSLEGAIKFTKEIEESFERAESIKDIHQKLMGRLGELTKMQKDADDLSGAKLENVIMDIIHNAAVVEELVEKRVGDKEDWGW